MSKPFRYPIPAEEASIETEVKQSRFIALGAYTPTVALAQEWIRTIRVRFADARHHCPAYRVGYGNSVAEWSSDDGEPRGTAGRPILSVMQGRDIGDISIVVVRYFGGIKLGTGGLVRAYGGAARMVLDELPTTMLVERCQRMLAVPYSQFERMKAFIVEHEGEIQDEDFAADIVFTFSMPVDRVEGFDAELVELSLGALEAIDLDE